MIKQYMVFVSFLIIIILSGNSNLGIETNQQSRQAAFDKNSQINAKLAESFLLSPDNSEMPNLNDYTSSVWTPDKADGTYQNPVLYADYSDPDVIRVNNDYYMTASSFSCLPGLPILHSKDLIHWSLIGHALGKYPNTLFERPQHGKGVWAPSLRYHNHLFYIYWGDPDAGIYMVRSSHPEGPWEKPVLVLPGLGMIDPCPLWDKDGQVYLIHAWAASRAGINSLLTVRRMNEEGTQTIGEGKHVYDGNSSQPTIEGPKLYQRNGYYYILAPAGGVKQGWQLALRSRNIYGPYETKVVLEQGDSSVNGPHQGAWIQTPSGQSWFFHFRDQKAYGRVVYLEPVKWQDDWPLMGRYNGGSGKYEPVLTHPKPDIEGHFPVTNPAESDEFNTDVLGLQWQWQANPKLTWYALLRNTHYLRLFAEAVPTESNNLWDAGNLLLQKLPAPNFTATTKVTFAPGHQGARAGLMIMGQDYGCLSLTETKDGLSLSQVTCIDAVDGKPEKILEAITLDGNTVYLRVTVSSPDAACRFSYSVDGNIFQNIGEPFDAKSGKWIGAKVGLFCVREPDSKPGGYADFDWFRIE